MIAAHALKRRFADGSIVIDQLSFEVRAGEFVALLGPSGCGKSTLLRLLLGLDTPDGGQLIVGGPGHQTSRSSVFQDATLLPWRTVIRNVMLPLEIAGEKTARARDQALAALQRVGLLDGTDLYPNQLSGGMRMRASLARALVTEPTILFLDEPFAALDEPSRFALQEELHGLWRRLGMTVVFVTHAVTEAVFLATRVLVLTSRPARLSLDFEVKIDKERNNDVRGDAAYVESVRVLQRNLFKSTEVGH